MNRALQLCLWFTLTVLVACSHSAQHVNLRASGAVYEKQFLIWFVRYHQDQDRMLQPCAQRADLREQLHEFCVEADRQHTERNERMRMWLSTWYHTDLPRPDPYPLWLATLNGQAFEREFLNEYLEHHDEGVEQTAKCASQAAHQELRDLCARVNPAQKKAGEQLVHWRCEWFKECS